jgi:DNA modification methylase
MEYRKLKDLKKLEGNPRIIRDKQFKTLCDSIRDNPKYFEARPVILSNRTGELVIIAGNQRYEAARFLKLKEVPTFLIEGLTDEKEKEITIRDNVSNGEWDFDALANGWDDLPLVDWGVDLPEDWLKTEPGEPADAEPQIDRAEELNKVWKVKTGDLWQIGEHRLLCGDSTKAEDVARVMGGEKADMVFTDPPYGIDRGEGFEGFGGFGKPIARRKHRDGEWDKTRPGKEAFDLILSLSDRVFIFGGNFFSDLLPQKNHWLVWDKKNTVPTFGDCELVWSSIARNSVKKYDFEYNGLIGKEKERFHPTQKPVGLLVKMMSDYGKGGESVFDGFIGSGTTMLSAENLKMKCFGIEQSADFCACILQRMTDAFPDIEIKRL